MAAETRARIICIFRSFPSPPRSRHARSAETFEFLSNPRALTCRCGKSPGRCPNGEAQAGLLGKYWSRRGVVFGGAYSGPRVRQLETARIVAEAYRSASLRFPDTASGS